MNARQQQAWEVLHGVLDPEVPVLSVCDLGIVREVTCSDQGTEVVLTPTYSGCPATEVISDGVSQALEAAGLGPVQITLRRAPAWTTDWMSEQGKRKLADYGIAPPGPTLSDQAQPMRWLGHPVPCPRCHSRHTEQLSAFGATACKSLYRCVSCREPFEHFKPL